MRVVLFEKVMAIKSPVKETHIDGELADYYTEINPHQGSNEINENLLIKNMPDDFFSSHHVKLNPQRVEIFVEGEFDEGAGRVLGNSGQSGLEIFADEGSKYSLLLCRYS